MSQQALIIFAKFPRPGEVKTRLGENLGMKEAAEVYRTFAEHAFSLGHQLLATGKKIYVFYEPRAGADQMRSWVGPSFHLASQKGETLGDRMRDAFEQTFAQGSARTVIIGTDVPELDAGILERAFDALLDHDAVIGPSTDGGYYLLGMNAPVKEVFDGLVWSAATVYHETLDRFRRLRLSFTELNELADIDTMADYNAYRERTGGIKSLTKGVE